MNKNHDNRRNFLKTAGLGSLTAAGTTGLLSSATITSCANINTKKKRIMVGRFSDETNTFINDTRTLEDVKKSAKYGDEVLTASGMVHGTIGTTINGFVNILEMYDIELIGSISVGGNHRIMTEEVFDYVTGYMLDTLDKYEVDGVYLSLHGGGCTIGHDDLEGETMELIRKKVGPDIPIVYTMDLHCQNTKLMTEVADAVSIYRTYPHIDAFECGYEIASILMGMLSGKIKSVMALKKLPLMIGPPLNVVTGEMPMKLVYDRAKEMQRTIPGVLTVCPGHGFMQQDIPTQGAGVLVAVDRDRELAQKLADELGDLMFSYRKEFWVDLPDTAETIRLAMKPNDKPFAISDGGDNMGAGGAGDGTHLLREILKQGVDSAFVQMYDPEAAKKAFEAGVGSTVTLDIGGRSDPMYGPPVTVTGKVSVISEEGSPWHPAARIEMKGVTILLNTKRIGPNNQTNVRAMGIAPEKYRMVVCKGGFAFRPQHPPEVYDYIMCATPGYSSPDLTTFEWKRIPRSMYPLDDI
ncbi:M81 family metallopeptidase [Candidatus Latescibacterota bacterium]